ncbi:MAG: ornithine carbamoyltransferase [Planctomycetota bacterium]|nr:MAG: ornithine carbamoyltransferase [Planctomycetota bacterium]
MRGRDLLSIADLSDRELEQLLDLGLELKRQDRGGVRPRPLEGKIVGLLFQKPSLRTRASFDVAAKHLGGQAVYMGPQEVGMGEREAVDDVALVVSRYFDAVVARVFAHQVVVDLAEHASVPVVNALSADEHPCQAIADLMTIKEWLGALAGLRVTYVGDGNNVAASLGLACAKVGIHYVCATPEGYALPPSFAEAFARAATRSGATYTALRDPREAARGAQVLYTDVWTSMGQEAEREARLRAFAGYCIDEDLLALADPAAIVLHCLPAHYGEEITREVSRHERSAIWDQAENRLHSSKALLAAILA